MEADRKGKHVRVKRDYQKGTMSNFDDLGQSKVDYLLDEVWSPDQFDINMKMFH